MEKELIKEAVKEAVREHMEEFYVEREKHYLDHKFIGDIREGTDRIRTKACASVTNGIVVGGLLLLLWGMVHWGEQLFNIKAGKP